MSICPSGKDDITLSVMNASPHPSAVKVGLCRALLKGSKKKGMFKKSFVFQVYENINWDTILGHLQGRITDEEEVKLLGAKAEDMKNRWATEPLSKCLKKPTSTEEDNEPSNEDGLMRLRSSVNQLLCTLGK